jgi:hypothetical protein
VWVCGAALNQAQDGDANNARNTREKRVQPQQALDPTTRAEENNGETTEGSAGVRDANIPRVLGMTRLRLRALA